MTDSLNTLARSDALIADCLATLENCVQFAHDEDCAAEACPDWERVFGTKETVVSVLGKLVSMQKTLHELQAKVEADMMERVSGPMSDEEWELLDLCVQRWKER